MKNDPLTRIGYAVLIGAGVGALIEGIFSPYLSPMENLETLIIFYSLGFAVGLITTRNK